MGLTEDTASVLNTVGVPTTAGTNSELIGGIPRVTYPWQPTPVEASFTLDVEVRGPNIDATNNTVTGTIQPFNSSQVYDDVYELAEAINASISGDAGLRGKVEAVVNEYGGLSFQTSGVYATDGTTIVSVVDNVGTLSGDNYLNFSNGTMMASATTEPGLEVVAAATQTQLVGGRDLTSLDNVGNFLDGEAGNDIDFVVTVNGVPETHTLTVPVGGWASTAAMAADINALPMTDATASIVSDRLVFTSNTAGDLAVSVNHLTSSTSSVDMTDFGMTLDSSFPPSVTPGLYQNDQLTIDLDSGGIVDTITLTAGTFADVDALVADINAQITASALLNGEVRALNDNGTLVFDRLNNPGAGTADIDITSPLAPPADTFTLDYFGVSTLDITDHPVCGRAGAG